MGGDSLITFIWQAFLSFDTQIFEHWTVQLGQVFYCKLLACKCLCVKLSRSDGYACLNKNAFLLTWVWSCLLCHVEYSWSKYMGKVQVTYVSLMDSFVFLWKCCWLCIYTIWDKRDNSFLFLHSQELLLLASC